MKLSPFQQQQLADLRDRLAFCEKAGFATSADVLRQEIRRLGRGVDPEAPQLDESDRRPRKRVTRSRPISQGRYIVNLTCGHQVTVNGVRSRQAPALRAPFTAICTVCNP